LIPMSNLKVLLASSDQPNSWGYKFRNQRFRNFEKFVLVNFPEEKQISVLDIGGASYFWAEKELVTQKRVKVTLLNLEKEDSLPEGLSSMVGDATDLSVFEDKSFDIVFSNSVIEHLYTWKNQQKMADEIQRVGKFYYVQTPNKHFFLEPHYAVPFIQYFPKKLSFWLLTQTKISRMQKWTRESAKQYLKEIRLLDLKEFIKLFPTAKVYKEKFFGMNKSFTAHNSTKSLE
jgi:predicted SAM-dependent methyltransferase